MPAAVATFAASFFTIGTTAATVAYGIGYVAGTIALSSAVSAIASPSGSGGSAQAAVMGGARVSAGAVAGGAALATSVPASDAPRRLIYGRVKAGGVPVYITQSDSGRFVDMAIYVAEGPLTGINTEVWIADDFTTDPKFAGLVSVVPYLGAPGQTHSAALAAVSRGEWTSAMVGNGCAWAHVRYEFDREAFDRGLIFPAFDVLGCPLFDPRTGLENGRADNPALVLLHFIRSKWAFKDRLLDQDIDFNAFAAAANVCDEVVVSVDPANVVGGVAGRVYRYSFNGVFEATGNPSSFVDAVCQSMAGHLINDGVAVRAYAGAWRAPTGPTLTPEYLRGAPTFRTHAGGQQRYNIARGTYREPRMGWEMTDYHEQSLGAALIDEEGEMVSPLDLPGVTNGAQAQRLARIAMMTARSAVPLILPCNYAAFQWQLFDTVSVNLPEVGAVGTFVVVQYDWASVEDGGGIDMALVPHLASDYAWDAATMEQTVQPLVAPTFRSLPAEIESLSLSGSENYAQTENVLRTMRGEWASSDWVMLSHYDVEFGPVGGEIATYQTSDDFIEVDNAAMDTTYQIRVRAVGVDGRTGGWSGVVTAAIAPDTTGPGPATALSVTGALSHQIVFTAPADPDLRFVQVGTVDGPGLTGFVDIWGISVRANTRVGVTMGLPAGTHYAVRGVDLSGNIGALVYAGVGTGDPDEYFAPQFAGIDGEISSLDGRIAALESA